MKNNADSLLDRNLLLGRVGSRPLHWRKQAFTLVEVTIALGIVAFVVVGMLGVIPVGLNAAQVSIEQTAETHILKQISSDLGMLPFSEVSSYIPATQYYDYDGRRLENNTGAIYQVSMESGLGTYPNSSQLTNLDQRLERVIVKIQRIGAPASMIKRCSFTVGNSGL